MRYFLLASLVSLVSLAAACSSDNCVRALRGHPESATEFCNTYTTATSTETTDLPTYATACANSPSRISSACSCVVTPTCNPSPVLDSNFVSVIAGADTWTSTVNPAPGQTVTPDYRFFSGSPNSFAVDFENTQPDPFLTTATLYQSNLTLRRIYAYEATINAIAENPLRENDCSIVAGFSGIDISVQNFTDIPWITPIQSPFFFPVNHLFTISGLPAAGVKTDFFLTVLCLRDDWWPRISIAHPNAIFQG
ncbi:hypothetical protein GQ53DRAFT_861207 [Thozetella sp. PMI_491]|nr:hypothetical protein GQ53DRAFT_861207 [Thozetella sp. PMI_491]